MEVENIRNVLRNGTSKGLKRRRWIGLLSAVGLVDFCIISMYQTGVIRRLPDLPGKIFDSNKVNASTAAYQLGLPDGPLSAGIYSLNLILSSYKGDKVSGRPRWANLALAATVMANAIGAAKYMKNMITEQEKACPYCIVGALLNFAMLPIMMVELAQELKDAEK